MSQSTLDRTEQPLDDDVIMRVRDATVSFDMNRGESRVLDNVSMDLRRNEILGVVGESGSGKSMFASALLDAVVEPGELRGEVIYNPERGEPFDVTDLSDEELREFRWEYVSMVFQGAMTSFNPVRTIKTHFVETLVAHDAPIDEGLERARDLLVDLHLDPDRILESYPHELSGGMSQRALIALSLVLEPEVLVMDEPTAALDLLMQQSIISLLKDIQEKYDLTIVFITHDLPLIAGLTDRLAVLYAFEFIEVGPSMDILTGSVHPYTRALLKSAPNLKMPLDEMQPIEGNAPDPVNVPAGCSYHPRCPLATDLCEADDPDFYEVSDEQEVSCHHWEDATDAIPLDLSKASEASTDFAEGNQSGETILSMDDVEVHFEDGGSGLLGRFFDDPQTVRAVDGISIDISDNDVFVLIGESGCGKSTLGKTSVGIQEPTGGTVEFKGQDIWRARKRLGDIDIPWGEIRRSLQIIHQDPASSLNPNRRVESLLADPFKRWHRDKSDEDRRKIILTLLEQVGMSPPEDYIDRYPHQLSGGEKQRVALIRAFTMNPELIFADEPVSALDVSLRVEMMNLMISLQDMFDTSFLFVSHSLANARYITGRTGGRIGVMYLGELVEVGPPEKVIHDPQHPYTRALRWATPELTMQLDDDDAPMRTIDVPDATNPPSGCRYHTRCQYARDICTSEKPSMMSDDETGNRNAACFRVDDDHEYWDSAPLEGTEKAE
ncbi:ABC transporter ATP-binding protein [Natrarchaeobius oligotrophus]|uniref:Nickel import system ATP-binding protein NikD n=1 Tax=Natrarchaeobius chitinivorans TaxID=1679083 RepID=A0A3N6MF40_NATCH|nr:ABC transporter ATP-binding protein [Natrarchaeobius chitinivorans]RQH02644.1 ABC transporter ATP-binding protein [Natrarchaeobius chitinivorans]